MGNTFNVHSVMGGNKDIKLLPKITGSSSQMKTLMYIKEGQISKEINLKSLGSLEIEQISGCTFWSEQLVR